MIQETPAFRVPGMFGQAAGGSIETPPKSRRGGPAGAETSPVRRRECFGPKRREASVRELVRTNDAVLVSAIGALLQGAGIPHHVFDQNMSVLEGSLGVLPRRILVADEHAVAARRLLETAGFGRELRPDAG